MPIIGLTDQGGRLSKLGTIRKGAAKTGIKPGQDLSTFRIASGNPEVLAGWEAAYAAHGGLYPKKIGVMLPFRSVDENLSAWREEWNSKSLVRRCDGETQHLHLEGDQYSREPLPCLNCPGKGEGCSYVARLQVIVPALKTHLGFFELETHSKWDILHLSQTLTMIEAAVGTLQGVPLVLGRVDREISTPAFKAGGGRGRVKKSLLDLAVHSSIAQPIMDAIEQAAHSRLAVALPEDASAPALPQSVQ